MVLRDREKEGGLSAAFLVGGCFKVSGQIELAASADYHPTDIPMLPGIQSLVQTPNLDRCRENSSVCLLLWSWNFTPCISASTLVCVPGLVGWLLCVYVRF